MSSHDVGSVAEIQLCIIVVKVGDVGRCTLSSFENLVSLLFDFLSPVCQTSHFEKFCLPTCLIILLKIIALVGIEDDIGDGMGAFTHCSESRFPLFGHDC